MEAAQSPPQVSPDLNGRKQAPMAEAIPLKLRPREPYRAVVAEENIEMAPKSWSETADGYIQTTALISDYDNLMNWIQHKSTPQDRFFEAILHSNNGDRFLVEGKDVYRLDRGENKDHREKVYELKLRDELGIFLKIDGEPLAAGTGRIHSVEVPVGFIPKEEFEAPDNYLKTAENPFEAAEAQAIADTPSERAETLPDPAAAWQREGVDADMLRSKNTRRHKLAKHLGLVSARRFVSRNVDRLWKYKDDTSRHLKSPKRFGKAAMRRVRR